MATSIKSTGSSGLAVYKYEGEKKKRKKRSRGLRGIEQLMRRAAMADSAFSKRYLREHRKSNRKKRDGWLRDLGDNLYKASKRGRKRFEARRVLRRIY